MKIAILHDYLHTYGGGERVLKNILKTFPEATFYSSCYFPNKVPIDLTGRECHFSALNNLKLTPFTKELISKLTLNVFKEFDLSQYDVILTSTSGPANWIKVNESQRVYSYFHKIPSFQFRANKEISDKDKVQSRNNSKNLLSGLRDKFKFIDEGFAKKDKEYVDRVNQIISNSKFYSANFNKIYNKDAEVIYPSIDSEILKYISSHPTTIKEDYYIYFGRLEEYKGIRFIIDACINENKKLIVVGEGSIKETLPNNSNVSYLGFVTDEKKFELISKAKAFINGSIEDFGIVFAESLALKTPIITLRGGGIHEISNDKNVIYFDTRDSEAVVKAISGFESNSMIVSDSDQKEILNRFSEAEFSKKLLQVVK